jgi:hypothetical protein
MNEYHSKDFTGRAPDPDISLVGPGDDESITGRGRSIDIHCVDKACMTT